MFKNETNCLYMMKEKSSLIIKHLVCVDPWVATQQPIKRCCQGKVIHQGYQVLIVYSPHFKRLPHACSISWRGMKRYSWTIVLKCRSLLRIELLFLNIQSSGVWNTTHTSFRWRKWWCCPCFAYRPWPVCCDGKSRGTKNDDATIKRWSWSLAVCSLTLQRAVHPCTEFFYVEFLQ